jgi:hypothetical protein
MGGVVARNILLEDNVHIRGDAARHGLVDFVAQRVGRIFNEKPRRAARARQGLVMVRQGGQLGGEIVV